MSGIQRYITSIILGKFTDPSIATIAEKYGILEGMTIGIVPTSETIDIGEMTPSTVTMIRNDDTYDVSLYNPSSNNTASITVDVDATTQDYDFDGFAFEIGGKPKSMDVVQFRSNDDNPITKILKNTAVSFGQFSGSTHVVQITFSGGKRGVIRG